MQPSIVKMDGIFGDADLDHIVWQDYTNQNIAAYQLLQVNGDGLNGGTIINRDLSSPKIYDKTTNEWKIKSPDIYDTLGWNIVFIRDQDGESAGFYYLCKDEDILKIPNVTGLSTYRTRINESVTPSNFVLYQKIEKSTGTQVIPVAPVSRSQGSNGVKIQYLILEKVNDVLKVGWAYIDTANKLNGSGRPFPQIAQYLQNPTDQPIRDLETRVSILENEVVDMQAQLAAHDKILKDLPAIVSAVSSNVSKLYVAR